MTMEHMWAGQIRSQDFAQGGASAHFPSLGWDPVSSN